MKRILLAAVALLLCLGAGGRGDAFPDVKRHLTGLAAADGRGLPAGWNAYPAGYEAALKTALDNLALTYVGENWMGPEPPGLNRTIGAYTAACVCYELLFGEAPDGTGYVPEHMEYDAARMEIARLCAHAACLAPGKVTDVGRKGIKVNYKESTLPAYTLPDPLLTFSPSNCFTTRRAIRSISLFEREMFGRAPGRPEALHFEEIYRNEAALGGQALRKEVRVHFDTTGRHYLRLMVYTPRNASGPVPVFLGINFKGNWAVSPETDIPLPTEEELKAYGRVETLERGAASARWPLESVLAAGYGVATFYRGDVDPDYDDGFENGVHPLFYREGQTYPDPDQWGAIAAWASAVSAKFAGMSYTPGAVCTAATSSPALLNADTLTSAARPLMSYCMPEGTSVNGATYSNSGSPASVWGASAETAWPSSSSVKPSGTLTV